MRGKGVSSEHSHPRRSSKNKTATKGKVKGTTGNVVIIDLDDDGVVIIDPAESSKQKFESSNVVREGIINIDDDEDSDLDPGICVDGDGDLVSDASSSKIQFPAFKTVRNSLHSETDECRVIREKTSAFQFSKCKQTYCTKASGRNCYGLDPASDNGSSDSDCSDCELMEDSFIIREQWDRILLKKKQDRNHHSGPDDQASASGSNGEAPTNAEEENGREQQQVPVCSSSSNADYGKENVSEFFATDSGNAETTSFKPPSDGSFMDGYQKGEQGSCPYWKPASVRDTEPLRRNADFPPGGGTFAGDPPCSLNCQSNKDFFDSIPGFRNEKDPSRQGSFQPGGCSVAEDPSCYDCRTYENVFDAIPGFRNEKEPSPQESFFMWFEREVGKKQSMQPKTSLDGTEKVDPGQSSVSNSRMFDEIKVDNGVSLPDDKFRDGPGEFPSCRTLDEGKLKGCSQKASYQDSVRADSNEPSLCETASIRTNIDKVESSFVEAKQPNNSRGLLDAQAGNIVPSVEGNLINEREKLKDTDEYKRAIEEEWAARQRELRIQVWHHTDISNFSS